MLPKEERQILENGGISLDGKERLNYLKTMTCIGKGSFGVVCEAYRRPTLDQLKQNYSQVDVCVSSTMIKAGGSLRLKKNLARDDFFSLFPYVEEFFHSAHAGDRDNHDDDAGGPTAFSRGEGEEGGKQKKNASSPSFGISLPGETTFDKDGRTVMMTTAPSVFIPPHVVVQVSNFFIRVAVKEVNLSAASDRPRAMLGAVEEACLLRQVRGSPHLLYSFTPWYSAEHDRISFPSELAQMDLSYYLKAIWHYVPPTGYLLSIAHQMILALKELRDCRVVHRDIKLENFLVFVRCNDTAPPLIKLGDFGLSVPHERLLDGPRGRRSVEVVGTPYYMAPECFFSVNEMMLLLYSSGLRRERRSLEEEEVGGGIGCGRRKQDQQQQQRYGPPLYGGRGGGSEPRRLRMGEQEEEEEEEDEEEEEEEGEFCYGTGFSSCLHSTAKRRAMVWKRWRRRRWKMLERLMKNAVLPSTSTSSGDFLRPPWPSAVLEEVVHARDVWALGCCVYQMVNGGTLPFRGNTLEDVRHRAAEGARGLPPAPLVIPSHFEKMKEREDQQEKEEKSRGKAKGEGGADARQVVGGNAKERNKKMNNNDDGREEEVRVGLRETVDKNKAQTNEGGGDGRGSCAIPPLPSSSFPPSRKAFELERKLLHSLALRCFTVELSQRPTIVGLFLELHTRLQTILREEEEEEKREEMSRQKEAEKRRREEEEEEKQTNRMTRKSETRPSSSSFPHTKKEHHHEGDHNVLNENQSTQGEGGCRKKNKSREKSNERNLKKEMITGQAGNCCSSPSSSSLSPPSSSPPSSSSSSSSDTSSSLSLLLPPPPPPAVRVFSSAKRRSWQSYLRLAAEDVNKWKEYRREERRPGGERSSLLLLPPSSEREDTVYGDGPQRPFIWESGEKQGSVPPFPSRERGSTMEGSEGRKPTTPPTSTTGMTTASLTTTSPPASRRRASSPILLTSASLFPFTSVASFLPPPLLHTYALWGVCRSDFLLPIFTAAPQPGARWLERSGVWKLEGLGFPTTSLTCGHYVLVDREFTVRLGTRKQKSANSPFYNNNNNNNNNNEAQEEDWVWELHHWARIVYPFRGYCPMTHENHHVLHPFHHCRRVCEDLSSLLERERLASAPAMVVDALPSGSREPYSSPLSPHGMKTTTTTVNVVKRPLVSLTGGEGEGKGKGGGDGGMLGRLRTEMRKKKGSVSSSSSSSSASSSSLTFSSSSTAPCPSIRYTAHPKETNGEKVVKNAPSRHALPNSTTTPTPTLTVKKSPPPPPPQQQQEQFSHAFPCSAEATPNSPAKHTTKVMLVLPADHPAPAIPIPTIGTKMSPAAAAAAAAAAGGGSGPSAMRGTGAAAVTTPVTSIPQHGPPPPPSSLPGDCAPRPPPLRVPSPSSLPSALASPPSSSSSFPTAAPAAAAGAPAFPCSSKPIHLYPPPSSSSSPFTHRKTATSSASPQPISAPPAFPTTATTTRHASGGHGTRGGGLPPPLPSSPRSPRECSCFTSTAPSPSIHPPSPSSSFCTSLSTTQTPVLSHLNALSVAPLPPLKDTFASLPMTEAPSLPSSRSSSSPHSRRRSSALQQQQSVQGGECEVATTTTRRKKGGETKEKKKEKYEERGGGRPTIPIATGTTSPFTTTPRTTLTAAPAPPPAGTIPTTTTTTSPTSTTTTTTTTTTPTMNRRIKRSERRIGEREKQTKPPNTSSFSPSPSPGRRSTWTSSTRSPFLSPACLAPSRGSPCVKMSTPTGKTPVASTTGSTAALRTRNSTAGTPTTRKTFLLPLSPTPFSPTVLPDPPPLDGTQHQPQRHHDTDEMDEKSPTSSLATCKSHLTLSLCSSCCTSRHSSTSSRCFSAIASDSKSSSLLSSSCSVSKGVPRASRTIGRRTAGGGGRESAEEDGRGGVRHSLAAISGTIRRRRHRRNGSHHCRSTSTSTIITCSSSSSASLSSSKSEERSRGRRRRERRNSTMKRVVIACRKSEERRRQEVERRKRTERKRMLRRRSRSAAREERGASNTSGNGTNRTMHRDGITASEGSSGIPLSPPSFFSPLAPVPPPRPPMNRFALTFTDVEDEHHHPKPPTAIHVFHPSRRKEGGNGEGAAISLSRGTTSSTKARPTTPTPSRGTTTATTASRVSMLSGVREPEEPKSTTSLLVVPLEEESTQGMGGESRRTSFTSSPSRVSLPSPSVSRSRLSRPPPPQRPAVSRSDTRSPSKPKVGGGGGRRSSRIPQETDDEKLFLGRELKRRNAREIMILGVEGCEIEEEKKKEKKAKGGLFKRLFSTGMSIGVDEKDITPARVSVIEAPSSVLVSLPETDAQKEKRNESSLSPSLLEQGDEGEEGRRQRNKEGNATHAICPAGFLPSTSTTTPITTTSIVQEENHVLLTITVQATIFVWDDQQPLPCSHFSQKRESEASHTRMDAGSSTSERTSSTTTTGTVQKTNKVEGKSETSAEISGMVGSVPHSLSSTCEADDRQHQQQPPLTTASGSVLDEDHCTTAAEGSESTFHKGEEPNAEGESVKRKKKKSRFHSWSSKASRTLSSALKIREKKRSTKKKDIFVHVGVMSDATVDKLIEVIAAFIIPYIPPKELVCSSFSPSSFFSSFPLPSSSTTTTTGGPGETKGSITTSSSSLWKKLTYSFSSVPHLLHPSHTARENEEMGGEEIMIAALYLHDQELPPCTKVSTLPPHSVVRFCYGEEVKRRKGIGLVLRPRLLNGNGMVQEHETMTSSFRKDQDWSHEEKNTHGVLLLHSNNNNDDDDHHHHPRRCHHSSSDLVLNPLISAQAHIYADQGSYQSPGPRASPDHPLPEARPPPNAAQEEDTSCLPRSFPPSHYYYCPNGGDPTARPPMTSSTSIATPATGGGGVFHAATNDQSRVSSSTSGFSATTTTAAAGAVEAEVGGVFAEKEKGRNGEERAKFPAPPLPTFLSSSLPPFSSHGVSPTFLSVGPALPPSPTTPVPHGGASYPPVALPTRDTRRASGKSCGRGDRAREGKDGAEQMNGGGGGRWAHGYTTSTPPKSPHHRRISPVSLSCPSMPFPAVMPPGDLPLSSFFPLSPMPGSCPSSPPPPPPPFPGSSFRLSKSQRSSEEEGVGMVGKSTSAPLPQYPSHYYSFYPHQQKQRHPRHSNGRGGSKTRGTSGAASMVVHAHAGYRSRANTPSFIWKPSSGLHSYPRISLSNSTSSFWQEGGGGGGGDGDMKLHPYNVHLADTRGHIPPVVYYVPIRCTADFPFPSSGGSASLPRAPSSPSPSFFASPYSSVGSFPGHLYGKDCRDSRGVAVLGNTVEEQKQKLDRATTTARYWGAVSPPAAPPMSSPSLGSSCSAGHIPISFPPLSPMMTEEEQMEKKKTRRKRRKKKSTLFTAPDEVAQEEEKVGEVMTGVKMNTNTNKKTETETGMREDEENIEEEDEEEDEKEEGRKNPGGQEQRRGNALSPQLLQSSHSPSAAAPRPAAAGGATFSHSPSPSPTPLHPSFSGTPPSTSFRPFPPPGTYLFSSSGRDGEFSFRGSDDYIQAVARGPTVTPPRAPPPILVSPAKAAALLPSSTPALSRPSSNIVADAGWGHQGESSSLPILLRSAKEEEDGGGKKKKKDSHPQENHVGKSEPQEQGVNPTSPPFLSSSLASSSRREKLTGYEYRPPSFSSSAIMSSYKIPSNSELYRASSSGGSTVSHHIFSALPAQQQLHHRPTNPNPNHNESSLSGGSTSCKVELVPFLLSQEGGNAGEIYYAGASPTLSSSSSSSVHTPRGQIYRVFYHPNGSLQHFPSPQTSCSPLPDGNCSGVLGFSGDAGSIDGGSELSPERLLYTGERRRRVLETEEVNESHSSKQTAEEEKRTKIQLDGMGKKLEFDALSSSSLSEPNVPITGRPRATSTACTPTSPISGIEGELKRRIDAATTTTTRTGMSSSPDQPAITTLSAGTASAFVASIKKGDSSGKAEQDEKVEGNQSKEGTEVEVFKKTSLQGKEPGVEEGITSSFLFLNVQLPEEVDKEWVCGIGNSDSTIITVRGVGDSKAHRAPGLGFPPQGGGAGEGRGGAAAVASSLTPSFRRLRVSQDSPIGVLRELLDIKPDFDIWIQGRVVEEEHDSFEERRVPNNAIVSFGQSKGRREGGKGGKRCASNPPSWWARRKGGMVGSDGYGAMPYNGRKVVIVPTEFLTAMHDHPNPAPPPPPPPLLLQSTSLSSSSLSSSFSSSSSACRTSGKKEKTTPPTTHAGVLRVGITAPHGPTTMTTTVGTDSVRGTALRTAKTTSSTTIPVVSSTTSKEEHTIKGGGICPSSLGFQCTVTTTTTTTTPTPTPPTPPQVPSSSVSPHSLSLQDEKDHHLYGGLTMDEKKTLTKKEEAKHLRRPSPSPHPHYIRGKIEAKGNSDNIEVREEDDHREERMGDAGRETKETIIDDLCTPTAITVQEGNDTPHGLSRRSLEVVGTNQSLNSMNSHWSSSSFSSSRSEGGISAGAHDAALAGKGSHSGAGYRLSHPAPKNMTESVSLPNSTSTGNGEGEGGVLTSDSCSSLSPSASFPSLSPRESKDNARRSGGESFFPHTHTSEYTDKKGRESGSLRRARVKQRGRSGLLVVNSVNENGEEAETMNADGLESIIEDSVSIVLPTI